MQTIRLGRSDLQVSRLAFGCMSLGDNRDLHHQLLCQAADNGINFFDTADLYDKGMNELQVGTALKSIRKKIILATKVGNQWRSDGTGWDWNPRKAYILKAAEQSLKRLKTDYIDLYQLHGGTIDDPIDETIEAFELLKQQGKIRWYGISSIRPNVIREYIKRSGIVSVMMQYSLLDRRPEEELLELLHKEGIAVLARGALAQGLLIGKPATPYLQFTDSEVARAARHVDKVAEQLETNPLSVALQYVLQQPAVASAVIGIRTHEQLDELIAFTRHSVSLPKEVLLKLQGTVRGFYYQDHR